MERAAKVKAVLFDKTGTLTEGHPSVVAVELFEPQVCGMCPSTDDLAARHHSTSAVCRFLSYCCLAATVVCGHAWTVVWVFSCFKSLNRAPKRPSMHMN